MGSKYIRNITKVLKSAANRIFGAGADGVPAELLPADVRTLISVYSTSEVDAIIGGIDGLTDADIDTLAEINAILTDADLASVSYVDSGLAGKQATLVSGTTIKSVNGTSLLGSGDIAVSASPGGSSGQVQYNNAGAFGGMTAVVYAASGTHVTVTSQGATVVPLCVKTAVSQTAPAVEIRNSANTVMASVYDTGGFYGVIFQASGTIISNKNQTPTNLGIQFSYGGGSASGIYGLAGGSQYVGITTNGSDSFRIDSSTTPGNTRMLLWDCDKGTTVRVSIGAADSGGSGYKLLRVPN